jgi:hypothetical protein
VGHDVLLVCEGADDGAEEHGGAEAGDEEAADVALVEAVLAVEVVDVGALQPVPRCNNTNSSSELKTSVSGIAAPRRVPPSVPDLNSGSVRRELGKGKGEIGLKGGAYTS